MTFLDDEEDDKKPEDKKPEDSNVEKENVLEDQVEDKVILDEMVEDEPETIKINPKEFGVELKVDPREADLDTERFVYHPEDGSISAKVDEHGCPFGYHWDEERGRCIPNVKQ